MFDLVLLVEFLLHRVFTVHVALGYCSIASAQPAAHRTDVVSPSVAASANRQTNKRRSKEAKKETKANVN